jgi:hypothetical protein
MGGIVTSSVNMNPVCINQERLSRIPIIQKDPYRFVLSKSEFRRAHHRVKRSIFSGTLVGAYLYYHIRFHNELRSVKSMKFTQIQLLHIIPRFLLLTVISYPLGYWLFKDWAKLANHDIALIELKKFDREYFNNNEYKYALINKPVYKHEESVYGRLYKLRYPFSYLQECGWIKRRKEANPHIEKEVPPKYDFTPSGPLSPLKIQEMRNKQLPFIGNNIYT